MIDENSPLRGKQAAFVECYFLCNFNGTAAARMAGYRGNDATLAAIAYENLRKPHIAAAIERKMKALTMAADEVLMRISQHAAGSMADFVEIDDESGDAVIDLQKAAKLGRLGLLRELKQTEIVSRQGDEEIILTRHLAIKLYDAHKAHNLLGKHYGLFGATGRQDNPVHIKVVGLDEALDRIYGPGDDDNG